MNRDDTPSVDVDALLEQLRRRVAERRKDGLFPDGLEADLDAHFERIAVHRLPTYEFDVLRQRVEALRRASSFSVERFDYDTKIPGGSFIHRLVGKLVSRQTASLLGQLQAHADAVLELATELTDALRHPKVHEHPELAGEVQMILDRLVSYERAATGGAAVAGLTSRLEAVEDTVAHPAFVPWFSNERFEAAFRGDQQLLRDRYEDLAREFIECAGSVVDIGCGRGEFLQLLIGLGVDATGIEIDPELVETAVARNLPVEYGDLVPWLEAQPPASLAGLSLIQVVEHLEPQHLARFVELAATKVEHGGKVVVETVNPQSLYVYAHSFYLDPTHKAPVHPSYLVFLFQEAGFAKVSIEWRSPCPSEDLLEPTGGDSELARVIDANTERVNRLLFAEQDYALIAVR